MKTKKISKLSKTLITAAAAIMFFTGGGFVGNKAFHINPSKENNFIELSAKEVMMVYQVGYVDGVGNMLKNKGNPNKTQYKKDSLFIVTNITARGGLE